MQKTFITENIIVKLILSTTNFLNFNKIKYQASEIRVFDYDNISNANIKFVEMMNIKL